MQKTICYCDVCGVEIGDVQAVCIVRLKRPHTKGLALEACNECYSKVLEDVKMLQSMKKLPE